MWKMTPAEAIEFGIRYGEAAFRPDGSPVSAANSLGRRLFWRIQAPTVRRCLVYGIGVGWSRMAREAYGLRSK